MLILENAHLHKAKLKKKKKTLLADTLGYTGTHIPQGPSQG